MFSYLPTWVFSRIPPVFFEGYVLERPLLPRYLYFHMFQITGAWFHVLLPAYLIFFANTPHLYFGSRYTRYAPGLGPMTT